MSITDELRAWAKEHLSRSSILAIADRIDAEHEKAMSRAGQLLTDAEKDRDYNYANWQECKQKVLQGNITFDELNAKIECLEDELLHRIELPKDADGELVHLGDVMEVESMTFRVSSIDYGQHPDIGDGMFWMLWNADGSVFERADQCRHRTSTVEDVLREFGRGWHEQMNAPETFDIADYVERYAAKLQLREDA